MLRTARTHPKISAYHALEGVHDFNRVPFAPPGGRWTIFNPPEKRGSWEPRALDAWYVGPAYNHYTLNVITEITSYLNKQAAH